MNNIIEARRVNLLKAEKEIEFLKEEFGKIDPSLTNAQFNRKVKSINNLCDAASEHLKTFKARSNSELFARISNYKVRNCANPECLNLTSTFAPNCSNKCLGKNSENRDKVRNTCLERYGVIHPAKLPEFQESIKRTSREKYGVEHHTQAKTVKDKIKATNMEKYGVECTWAADEVKDKIKQANLKKFGVDNPSKAKIVQDKIKATCLEKYGVERPWQNQEVYQKFKSTNLERYGFEYASQSEDVKDKSKLTCMERYGVEYSLQAEEIKEMVKQTRLRIYGVEHVLQNEKIKAKMRKNHLLKRYDSICSNELLTVETSKEEFESGLPIIIKCSKCDSVLEYPQLRCFDCYPLKTSFEQNEVRDYILSLGFEVIEKDRTIISPKEIDILIPAKKIGIEYNGVYWHSEEKGTPANYHADKNKAARQAGYRLIHLFSDQWKNKKEIVKKRLRHILGLETRTVYARKCQVVEISPAEAREFLNENHIQGAGNAKIKLALKYENEIVAVMTFSKPRFNKNYDYEMIRFATNCNVPGGASKLLTAFRRMIPSASIITYADKSWSDGNLYRQLGFTELKDSAPSYFWTNEKVTYKRYETMKHKLGGILENFDPLLSESENMKRNRFDKVYDCGNKVFELKY